MENLDVLPTIEKIENWTLSFLRNQKTEITAQFLCFDEKSEQLKFQFTISKGKNKETYDWFCGVLFPDYDKKKGGMLIRTNSEREKQQILNKRRGIVREKESYTAQLRIRKPISNFLHSMLSDYFCVREIWSETATAPVEFEEFCSNLGYEEDSRQAERIYRNCVHAARQLEGFFTPQQLIHLYTEVFQDF